MFKNISKFLIIASAVILNSCVGSVESSSGQQQANVRQEVKDYPIGGGKFTGILYNGEPYTGTAVDIDYLGGKYNGVFNNGKMQQGYTINIKYNGDTYIGDYSGEVINNLPAYGVADKLCKVKTDECYSGSIVNGVYYSGTLVKANVVYNMKQGAPSNGYPKKQTAAKTPFQAYLDEYALDNSESNLVKVVLGEKGRGATLSMQQKVDINNDNIRRFFETSLAKNMLLNLVKEPASFAGLRELANNLTKFERFAMNSDGIAASAPRDKMAINNIREGKRWYADWTLASQGLYCGNDTTLRQLSLTIGRYVEILKNPDYGLTVDQQKLILDLFKIHYLSYKVQNGPLYKILSSKTGGEILDLYKTHPYFVKRGRYDIGSFKLVNSKHMGILRNSDVGEPNSVYMDMNKPVYDIFSDRSRSNLETRCPDRFDMSNLDMAPNAESDAWLTINFDNGVSPVINGMSGSMLVEIKFLLFAKRILKSAGGVDAYELRSFGINSDFLNNAEVIMNYYRMINSLFIYFEGGHSLYEINTPFELPETRTWVNKIFGFMLNGLSMHNLLLAKENQVAVESSVAETLDFYHNFRNYEQQMKLERSNNPIAWQ